MKVSVIGCGNVGVSIAADLSIKGQEVTLIKTSDHRSEVFMALLANSGAVFLKERGEYKEAVLGEITRDLSRMADSDVVIVTVQSACHESLIRRMSPYLSERQTVICICGYMSYFYFRKYCDPCPAVAETTGPYLEGRVDLEDTPGKVVFRVGCRLSLCPMSLATTADRGRHIDRIRSLSGSFRNEYSVVEAALLNPNMVLHTVGSLMSLSRIEYSGGDFCMYREAYARGNEATLNVMFGLDTEKKIVLKTLGQKPIGILEAAGFAGDNRMESFHRYSESGERATGPTSVRSRYIVEDVSQGLVLLESIANRIDVRTPVTSSIITLSGAALGRDFREEGRTLNRLGAQDYIYALWKRRAT